MSIKFHKKGSILSGTQELWRRLIFAKHAIFSFLFSCFPDEYIFSHKRQNTIWNTGTQETDHFSEACYLFFPVFLLSRWVSVFTQKAEYYLEHRKTGKESFLRGNSVFIFPAFRMSICFHTKGNIISGTQEMAPFWEQNIKHFWRDGRNGRDGRIKKDPKRGSYQSSFFILFLLSALPHPPAVEVTALKGKGKSIPPPSRRLPASLFLTPHHCLRFLYLFFWW